MNKIVRINHLVLAFAIAFVIYNLATLVIGIPFLWNVFSASNKTSAQSHPQVVREVKQQTTSNLGIYVGEASWPTRVVIPVEGIDLTVTGSYEKAGQWDISNSGANFAINTAVPDGKTGNTALFGHDISAIFYNLHWLLAGDLVKVYANGFIYTYSVTGNTTVIPTDVSVMDQTTEPRLTLITCTGWLSENRYVVIAKFIGKEPVNLTTSTN
jgi:LPXTG-site transpeptidase (sortase) family protein